MATWNRVASGSTAGNISMNVDIGIQSVKRTSNTNVRVVYGVRFIMATIYYTYNNIAAFCPKDGTKYYAFGGNGGSHTVEGTYYYANKTSVSTTTRETCPFTIDIPVTITQTSASFEIGYGWDEHSPSQKGSSSITVTFPTGATAPTGCWCSASPTSETSFSLSGGYGSNGNATITATGFQYKKDGTSSWTNCSSTPSGLSVNSKYYFRYYATNSQGTSYSDGSANATSYDYPNISNTQSFIIGNNIKMKLNNPLGRSCTLYILGNDDSVICAGTRRANGSIEISSYSSEIAAQYNSIPNSKSGNYKVRLVCSEVSRDTTVNGSTYSIKDNGTEIPTFAENYWSYVANLTQLTNNNQVIINGYSKVDFSINTPASSNYGSPISYYNYKWGNSSNRTGSITGGNGNVLEVSAVDSRGLSKTTNKTLVSGTTYIPYNIPTLDYSNSYTQRVNGIAAETHLTLQGNLSVMKFGSDGIANAIHSCKYKVYNYNTGVWSDEFTIPVNEISLNSSGYFSLNNYMIHANGSSGGFTVGVRYDIQIILQDANGLLATLTSNLIQVTDGKIARDVYQDSNGDYHQGINGMGNDNFANTIHGSENITDALYINGVKMIWYE